MIDTNGGGHRGNIYPINGVLQGYEQFAIDYTQIGPNDTCCNGPPAAPSSWWGYGTPILAAAPGVVVEVVDGLPDQQPVGTISPDLPLANYGGNSVIEDIGGGRYIGYAHLQPGSIPASVREGAPLRTGDLIGRLGNSGNTTAPHLHFQVMDRPSFFDDTALPFVFDTQLLEGHVHEWQFFVRWSGDHRSDRGRAATQPDALREAGVRLQPVAIAAPLGSHEPLSAAAMAVTSMGAGAENAVRMSANHPQETVGNRRLITPLATGRCRP